MLDIITFLEALRHTYLTQANHPRNFDVAGWWFITFVHHRSFEQINQRIELRRRLWDDEPFVLLAAQTPIPIEPVPLHFGFASSTFTQVLSSGSLICNDRDGYVVNTNNIRIWVLVLEYLRHELRTIISNGTNITSVGDCDGKRKALKAESYVPFVHTTHALCRLLECKLLVQAIEKAYCNADAFLVSHGQDFSSLYLFVFLIS